MSATPRRPRPPGEMEKTRVANPRVSCGSCRQFDGSTWCRHWSFFTTADSPPCRFFRAVKPTPET
ncbi:MAG: hypothetical protein ACREPA_01960 [Candidatus Dormibacteraceae bacterium]